MAGQARTTGAGRSRSRRWLYRLLAMLLALVLVWALDRLLRVLWFLPTYSNSPPPQLIFLPQPINKDFIHFVPDRWLIWKLHRSATLHMRSYSQFTGQELRYDIITNRLGFRGPDARAARPPGALRVVVMGGSSTMGFGCSDQQTYARRLEAALGPRFPGRRVEVINAGVEGYTSSQGFMLYHRVVSGLRPDLVIAAYDVNDGHAPMTVDQAAAAAARGPTAEERDRAAAFAHDPYREITRIRQEPGLGKELRSLLYESGLFFTAAYARRWLRDRYFRDEDTVLAYPELEAPRVDPGKALARCPTPHVLGATGKPWDEPVIAHRRNLRALDALARRDGAAVIYLSVPLSAFGDIRPAIPYREVMMALARGPARAYVDPSESFCEHPLGQVMLDFCHPTARGHALIAEALLEPATRLLRARTAGPGGGRARP